MTSDPATNWTVVDTGSGATGSVSPSGLFTAGATQGDVTVQAVYAPEGAPLLSANADVTISGAQLLSVVVAPGSATFHHGTVESFTATATFDGGTQQDVTAAASWTSSAPDIALASCDGVAGQVCAQDAGTATLTASYRSESGQSALTVLPSSALLSLSVTPANVDVPQGPAICETFQTVGTYADNTTGPVEANWSLQPNPGVDGGVAFVAQDPSQSSQICLADNVPAQIFDIDADAGALDGSATLTVCASTVTKLTLVPPNATLHCDSNDGGPPCVFLAAEALERSCGQSSLATVNAIASWDAGTLPTGLTFFDGLLCGLPAGCPTGQSISIAATYGGKNANASVTTAP